MTPPTTTPSAVKSARACVGLVGAPALCVPMGLRAIAAASAQQRKPRVRIYSPTAPEAALPEGLTYEPELEEMGARCHLILLAMPAAQMREQVRALSGFLDGSHMLLHAVRGFEPGRNIPMSALIREETCVRKVGALVGPSLLLLNGEQPGAAVVASRFAEVISATQQAFSGPTFRVYGNADLEGVEASSVLIGALSVAVGLCAEMDLGPAVESLLLTRGLAEITRFVKAFGGQPHTPFGLSGLGDLMVQREVDSPEVRLGRLLLREGSVEAARSQSGDTAAEVVASLRSIVALGQRKGVTAHIIPTVYDLLSGECSPREAMQRLMSLQQMTE
jgi:glycerol-3-phosphate dehydrogenase (NAD(P)+)